MSEICTPPTHGTDENGDDTATFTVAHTWGDVVRWICRTDGDREDVEHLLKMTHKESDYG